jgi:hypothetical protein
MNIGKWTTNRESRIIINWKRDNLKRKEKFNTLKRQILNV